MTTLTCPDSWSSRSAPRFSRLTNRARAGVLGYMNAVIGLLREGGFSIAQAHHAVHILGSRLLGFARDLFDDSADLDPEQAASLANALGDPSIRRGDGTRGHPHRCPRTMR